MFGEASPEGHSLATVGTMRMKTMTMFICGWLSPRCGAFLASSAAAGTSRVAVRRPAEFENPVPVLKEAIDSAPVSYTHLTLPTIYSV